ncbi:MAG: hypothetical protein WCY43_03955 [Patescibacteria group bacterium]|nr:hypothetical protein [Patescibacteria group bacterium]
MDKKIFSQEIERKEELELITKAQSLINSHYEIQQEKLIGEKSEKELEGLEEFKKELSRHIKIDKMSNADIYKMARKLVIETAKELKRTY